MATITKTKLSYEIGNFLAGLDCIATAKAAGGEFKTAANLGTHAPSLNEIIATVKDSLANPGSYKIVTTTKSKVGVFGADGCDLKFILSKNIYDQVVSFVKSGCPEPAVSCPADPHAIKLGLGNMADSQMWYLKGMDIAKLPNPVPQKDVAQAIGLTVSGPWNTLTTYTVNPKISSTRSYQVDVSTVNGTHYFDVKDVWNYGVKNALVTSGDAQKLYFDGFVHVDVNVGICTAGDSIITINGSKRGNIVTGEGNDQIYINLVSNGPEWSNVFRIATGGGNDTIVIKGLDYSQEANDPTFQKEGAGLDTSGKLTTVYIDLGAGNDGFWGGGEKDMVWGGDGNDTVVSGAGNDTIFGGAGNDKIWSGEGNDNVFGDEGNDTIMGGQGNDDIYGGQGDDLLYGEEGNDTLHGNDGNDWMSGGEGNDVLYGDMGNDTLCGLAGNDKLFGGTGDDYVLGGDGNDFLDTGLNSLDWLDTEITTLLSGGTVNSAALLAIGERANGENGNDTFVSRGENSCGGFQKDGTDVFTGGAGADKFYFGIGHGHDVITDFVGGKASGNAAINAGDRLLVEGAVTGASTIFKFFKVNFDGGNDDLLVTLAKPGCGCTDKSETILLKDFFTIDANVLDVSKYNNTVMNVTQLAALGKDNIFDFDAADHNAVTNTLNNFLA